MALATLADVQLVPGMSAYAAAYLTMILAGADRAIKTFLKRDIELTTYTEYYSGNSQQDLVLNQFPVVSVTSVYESTSGYWGQGISPAFPAGTLMTQGTQYALVLDNGGVVSNRGLLRRLGAGPAWWPAIWGTGKLAASKLPSWTLGSGNIKVTYVAGYSVIPADLKYACVTLTVWMAKMQPFGGHPVSSENFEAYSYNLLSSSSGGAPELGTVLQTLKYYRESSW